MAKFRNGNLVLTSSQTIVHGSSTVLDATRKGLFNSLQLDATLTNINEFSTDTTLAGNSDTALPTEKAVKSYVDTSIGDFSTNKIYQGDSSIEVIDVTGGKIEFKTDNAIRWKMTPLGRLTNYNIDEGLIIGGSNYIFQVLGTSYAASSMLLGRFSNDGNESYFRFLKSRSTAPESFSALTNSDNIGSIVWNCDDGSTYNSQAARILAEVVGTVSTGITPGRIRFWTNDASGVSNERLRINPDDTIICYASLNINNEYKAAGYLYSGSTDPTNTSRLNYDGYFYATRVYNAIWNDIADFQDLADPEFIAGKCYYDTLQGAYICSERCQKSVIGIASDTFGYGVGQDSNKTQVSIAVCGWVLAYVNDATSCVSGDVLTNDADGSLVKMTDQEKALYPERIVGVYKKPETAEFWGPNNQVAVNGRHWVKVK